MPERLWHTYRIELPRYIKRLEAGQAYVPHWIIDRSFIGCSDVNSVRGNDDGDFIGNQKSVDSKMIRASVRDFHAADKQRLRGRRK